MASSSEQQPAPGPRNAPDVTVRRAPRMASFLVVGALLGLMVGLVLAAGISEVSLKPGVTMSVMIFSTAGLGCLVGGVVALIAEKRSLNSVNSSDQPSL